MDDKSIREHIMTKLIKKDKSAFNPYELGVMAYHYFGKDTAQEGYAEKKALFLSIGKTVKRQKEGGAVGVATARGGAGGSDDEKEIPPKEVAKKKSLTPAQLAKETSSVGQDERGGSLVKKERFKQIITTIATDIAKKKPLDKEKLKRALELLVKAREFKETRHTDLMTERHMKRLGAKSRIALSKDNVEETLKEARSRNEHDFMDQIYYKGVAVLQRKNKKYIDDDIPGVLKKLRDRGSNFKHHLSVGFVERWEGGSKSIVESYKKEWDSYLETHPVSSVLTYLIKLEKTYMRVNPDSSEGGDEIPDYIRCAFAFSCIFVNHQYMTELDEDGDSISITTKYYTEQIIPVFKKHIKGFQTGKGHLWMEWRKGELTEEGLIQLRDDFKSKGI